jgi:hypothetical protein
MSNILYVGVLNYGGTCLQRFNALRDLGHNVRGIDTNFYSKFYLYFYNILTKFKINPDILGINKKIIQIITLIQFDIIWIDKGLIIKPKTLELVKNILPNIKIVSYSPDDMMNPKNQTNYYLQTIPLYDYHITTKSYNVYELKNIGAKKVILIDNAFDPTIHKPIELSEKEYQEYSADVGFIGQFEKERFNTILFLAKNNIKVTIHGIDWEKYKNVHPNLIIKPGWISGEKYTKCICATKINLCFLRKVNRDLQTTRSIEIPACRGFMLGERTDEHLKLFQEGSEAEFFSNEKELLNKIEFYLNNKEKRLDVASNGYERCIKGNYSNQNRLNLVLMKINDEA